MQNALAKFFNQINALIDNALKRKGYCDAGNVTEYDPDKHSVKVMISPQMIESDFIPIKGLAATPNGGVRFAPNIGDPCLIKYYNGNRNHPIYDGAYFNDQTPPVGNTKAGEWLFMHSSGSILKFYQNGDIDLFAASNLNLKGAKINAEATTSINLKSLVVNIEQNVYIKGNLSASNNTITMTGDGALGAKTVNASNEVTASGVSLKSHLHTKVTTGNDQSGPPG